MRWRHIFAVVTVGVAISGTSGGAESTAESRFLAVEQAWMDALSKRDAVTLEITLAPAFTIIGSGSTAESPLGDRAEWLKNAGRFPWPRHDVRIIKVHEVGDAAVVHCVLTGEYPPNSITAEGGRVSFLVTDTWVKRDSRWQVLARHASLAAPTQPAPK